MVVGDPVKKTHSTLKGIINKVENHCSRNGLRVLHIVGKGFSTKLPHSAIKEFTYF